MQTIILFWKENEEKVCTLWLFFFILVLRNAPNIPAAPLQLWSKSIVHLWTFDISHKNSNKFDDQKIDNQKFEYQKFDDQKFDGQKFVNQNFDNQKYDDQNLSNQKFDNQNVDDQN